MRRNPRPIPVDRKMVKKVTDQVFDYIFDQVKELADSNYAYTNWDDLILKYLSSNNRGLEDYDILSPLLPIEVNLDVQKPSGEVIKWEYILLKFSYTMNKARDYFGAPHEYFRGWVGSSQWTRSDWWQENQREELEENKLRLSMGEDIIRELSSEIGNGAFDSNMIDNLFQLKPEVLGVFRDKASVDAVIFQMQNGGTSTSIIAYLANPHIMFEYMKKHKRKMKQFLHRMVSHELVHGMDKIDASDGVEYNFNLHEGRAEMRAILEMLHHDLIEDNPTYWDNVMKHQFATQPFDVVFRDYLEYSPYFTGFDAVTQDKIRFAIIQWLQENGFNLPRRRL